MTCGICGPFWRSSSFPGMSSGRTMHFACSSTYGRCRAGAHGSDSRRTILKKHWTQFAVLGSGPTCISSTGAVGQFAHAIHWPRPLGRYIADRCRCTSESKISHSSCRTTITQHGSTLCRSTPRLGRRAPLQVDVDRVDPRAEQRLFGGHAPRPGQVCMQWPCLKSSVVGPDSAMLPPQPELLRLGSVSLSDRRRPSYRCEGDGSCSSVPKMPPHWPGGCAR
jgi:hypothetical protein